MPFVSPPCSLVFNIYGLKRRNQKLIRKYKKSDKLFGLSDFLYYDALSFSSFTTAPNFTETIVFNVFILFDSEVSCFSSLINR